MGKDTHLVNIYIKIHNNRTLTMDDLKYLSKYDPECFEKTCRNIVYKIPETKEILQPTQTQEGTALVPVPQAPPLEKQQPDREQIETVLSNLGKMEMKELPIQNVDTDTVKGLLGNLYMELLFPHNDRAGYFSMEDSEIVSVFNKKV